MNSVYRNTSNIIRLISFTLLSLYSHSFRIVLLSHTNEKLRPTNTGKLLLAQENAPGGLEYPGITDVLIWEGRGDNIKISDAIARLYQPVLVWTEAPKELRTGSGQYKNPTYIILDGTWQEAKKIFRSGPDCLRNIPRISLEPSFQSTYKLRANFGYIDRFTPVYANAADVSEGKKVEICKNLDGQNIDENKSQEIPNPGSSLLCTAEVGASLLLQHGYNDRARKLLSDLEVFQMTFESYSNSK